MFRVGAMGFAIALFGASPAPIVQPALGGTPWTADRIAKLDADVDTLLANDPALRGAHYGVYALDTATASVLYAHAQDDEIQPASTLKLLVGSAAVEKLGPTYSYRTTLSRTQTGSESGETVLLAGGDPFLEADDLDAALTALGKAGVTKLRGDVTFDDRRYERKPYPDGWTWDDFAYAYAPRVSALSFEENVVHISVGPAETVGRKALVTTTPITASGTFIEGCPALANVHVDNFVRTAGADSDPDAIAVERAPGGCIQIVGTIPLGSAVQKVDAAVPSPNLYALAYLDDSLKRHGITHDLVLAYAPFPFEHDAYPERDPRTVVWSHDSAPLANWLGPRFWIPSDNLVGEMLLKELGFVTAGAPGTTAAGVAYEKTWLQTIGIDPATVTLADGCGMSQYDRITPRDLVTILQHDWNGPNRQLVLDSLPVGGARGTIEGIAGTPAAGRVFAKTGSMMHVRGLAGYLATLRHGAVTFAFQVDDWNGDYPSLATLRASVLSRIVND